MQNDTHRTPETLRRILSDLHGDRHETGGISVVLPDSESEPQGTKAVDIPASLWTKAENLQTVYK